MCCRLSHLGWERSGKGIFLHYFTVAFLSPEVRKEIWRKGCMVPMVMGKHTMSALLPCGSSLSSHHFRDLRWLVCVPGCCRGCFGEVESSARNRNGGKSLMFSVGKTRVPQLPRWGCSIMQCLPLKKKKKKFERLRILCFVNSSMKSRLWFFLKL